MPGFTLQCSLNENVAERKNAFQSALNDMLVLEGDRPQTLWEERTILLGSTAYDEYPTFLHDDDTWRVYLEGHIHNRDRSDALCEAQERLDRVLRGDTTAPRRLTDWLLDIDGEFVAILLHKPRQQLFLFNDVFARLPVYYHGDKRMLVLSRNVRPVRSLSEAREYDRLSIAHYLLWGYYAQPNTYLKSVFRLKPASLLTVNLKEGNWSLDTLHVFNFDDQQQPEEDIQDNAAQSASLFADACRNRTTTGDVNLVSLSGGLDSRSVAAALHLRNTPFRAASFVDFERTRAFDADVGAQLAELFNAPRTVFELGPPTGDDALKALRVKNGFNYLGVSFLMQYFEALRAEYGRGIRYFSGNGGDRMLQFFQPNVDFQHIEQLVEYLVNRRRLFTLDEISRITRTSEQDILDSLGELLSSFPEQDLNQKLIHAELYGDGLSRHLEGEDRIRAFFWTASPFWSVHFFRFVMQIPDRQKRMFRLYKRFLKNLSPEAAAIVYPNVNAPVGSLRHRLFVASKDVRWFLGRFRKRPVQHTHSPDLLRCLQAQLKNCEAIADWLSVPALGQVLDDPERYKHEAIETLFTITSIIEDLETGRSSIEDFRDAVFSVPSDSWEWFKHKPFRVSG